MITTRGKDGVHEKKKTRAVLVDPPVKNFKLGHHGMASRRYPFEVGAISVRHLGPSGLEQMSVLRCAKY
jgi:hypothetical protein